MNLTANLTDNGSTAVIDWDGGVGYYAAHGTFGGGTLKLEYSFDNGGNYIPSESSGWLASAAGKQFHLPPCKLRMTLSGAASPNLSVYIR